MDAPYIKRQDNVSPIALADIINLAWDKLSSADKQAVINTLDEYEIEHEL